MNHFNEAARNWDNNPIHWDRSKAIASAIKLTIPLNSEMTALEYGAGTAILSFILQDQFKEITLMDSSTEMVKVMEEKVAKNGFNHLKPLLFDLEHTKYSAKKFDLVFSQMVFHHVENIDTLLQQFYKIINSGGHLIIADLYTEDGTFHDANFNGHKGFDPGELARRIANYGFENVKHKQCYVIKRESPNGTTKEYPVFLLTALKK
jgi:ubiquinone/menaquinone biosynthesis C-methylase UbiE